MKACILAQPQRPQDGETKLFAKWGNGPMPPKYATE